LIEGGGLVLWLNRNTRRLCAMIQVNGVMRRQTTTKKPPILSNRRFVFLQKGR
jgi:hypothetical protein